MKEWMIDETKQDFPTLDRVLFTLLFEADKHLKILPELNLGQHASCFQMVCKSLRTALNEDNLPKFISAKIMDIARDHSIPEKGATRDWDLLIQINVWKMLEHAAIALHGAVGNGLITEMSGGLLEVHRNDCVMLGLTGVLAHASTIRHFALNPATTWKLPYDEKIQSLADIPGLEPLSTSRPQWAVDILDADLPDGSPRLSEKAFGHEVKVQVPFAAGIETTH
jgi:hypothetical protein